MGEEEEALIQQTRIQQQHDDEQQREQIQQQLHQQQLDEQQLENLLHQLEVQKHRQVQQQLYLQQEELRHQQQQLEKRLGELQRRHVTDKVNFLTGKVFEVVLDCKGSECESRIEEFEPKRAPIARLIEEFALDVVREVNNAKAVEGKTHF